MTESHRQHLREIKTKHGMCGTRLYWVWASIIGRTSNPNNQDYHDYGGRGITVCSEWRDASTFIEWALKNGYREGLRIERIDNENGYSPDNCRWATDKEQARNKRNNRVIEFRGERHCLSEWAEITGLPSHTIKSRLNLGWTAEDALTVPQGERKTNRPIIQLTVGGEFVRTFGAAAKVEKELGYNAGNIGKICKGKGKTIGGYKWKYCEALVPVCSTMTYIW